MNFKEWINLDNDIEEWFWFVVIAIILNLLLVYLIFPNLGGSSDYQDDMVPDAVTGDAW